MMFMGRKGRRGFQVNRRGRKRELYVENDRE
jgi:hypothetical protein